MWRIHAPSGMLAVIGPPVIAIISAWFLSLLPSEVFALAFLWVLVSLPPAMLFGHCVLSER